MAYSLPSSQHGDFHQCFQSTHSDFPFILSSIVPLTFFNCNHFIYTQHRTSSSTDSLSSNSCYKLYTARANFEMRGCNNSVEPKGPPGWKVEPNTKWLYSIDGVLWPIVLLDDESVHRDEQEMISKDAHPALQLGGHKMSVLGTSSGGEY